ncbi:hypothetical protein K402DRAFT_395630 [Aulographum hederae CBS 113979]|uniref:Ino eighty subunit 1 n=1 Tax=Aulographum hederae CBS 113979 TaxID=1176131 RepID=A0A6G1GUH4_9PEZI|nr:hypothetical protein K402DRAFT_395630 [Aulographum hederae CBS 113979]
MDALAAATSAASRPDEPDPRNSLKHVLAADPEQNSPAPAPETPVRMPEVTTSHAEEDEDGTEMSPQIKQDMDVDMEDEADGGSSRHLEVPNYTATTTTTRRNANGSVSSVYSGNKIRHLKKDDGVPLWRKDIQYDFLRGVFDDDKKVFHKVSDGTGGHSFADIYLDAMAKSSKCSKILKDKLLTERGPAINMAMVCLLVNVGRMNTTLNFFPEMRAQLRTYHSIPSLQAHQDPNAYKQLQDAPRLKSILKGATEDVEQPSTLDDIRQAKVPRTNPVNLIFVLAQYAPKISEMHFDIPRDFFDLVMKPGLSSQSRATAFLWLMWWYLESDFSKEDALANPYGPGRANAEGEMPIKLPQFEILTDGQAADENVDTVEEEHFGEMKRLERIAILKTDMAPVVTGPKRGSKKNFNNNPVFSVVSDDGAGTPQRDDGSPAPSLGTSVRSARGGKHIQAGASRMEDPYDSDRTRSASPPAMASTGKAFRINTILNDEAPPTAPPPVPKGPGRGNWRRNRDPNATSAPRSVNRSAADSTGSPSLQATGAALSNGPHGFYLPLNGSDPTHKRSRPLTAHQLAVEKYRKERVDFILDRRVRTEHKAAKRRRQRDGIIARAWKRARTMPDGYDSEEELMVMLARRENGMASRYGEPGPGFVGITPVNWEREDVGEETFALAQSLRRASRRLERWEGGKATVKKKKLGVEERQKEREREEREEWEGIYKDAGRENDPDGDGDGDGYVEGETMMQKDDDEIGHRPSSLPSDDEVDEDEESDRRPWPEDDAESDEESSDEVMGGT